MSFQRIFEMARRQGMPLVMTDRDGEDPVVVLPLDVYEALVEANFSQGEDHPHASARIRTHPQKQEQERAEPKITETPKSEKTELENDLLAELSVEERFYIDTPNEERIG